MSKDRFAPLAERIRTAAALVEGSLLDEATWAVRHRWISPLQRDLLMAINPHRLAQGWLCARSMPVAEFEAWVADRKLALRE